MTIFDDKPFDATQRYLLSIADGQICEQCGREFDLSKHYETVVINGISVGPNEETSIAICGDCDYQNYIEEKESEYYGMIACDAHGRVY